jgi:hypothetical protein
MSAAHQPGRGGTRPVTSMHYGRVRDAVLTLLGSAMARSTRPLWYAETIVLSARFQQMLASASWAANSVRCRDRLLLWEEIAAPRLHGSGAVVLEFGVAEGYATYWWAEHDPGFSAWHGFDTFAGLPTAWARAGVPVMAAGVFTPSRGIGSVPEPAAGFPFTWHTGLIEDTLPSLARPDAPLFIMIDVDLLEPTVVILDWLRVNGRRGDLVYFDEAFDPWNEGLALARAVDNGLEVRAVAHTGSAALVELTQP